MLFLKKKNKSKTDVEIWKYVSGLTGHRLNPDEGHSSLALVGMSTALMLKNPRNELTTCLLQKSEQCRFGLNLMFTCIYNTDTLLTRENEVGNLVFDFNRYYYP